MTTLAKEMIDDRTYETGTLKWIVQYIHSLTVTGTRICMKPRTGSTEKKINLDLNLQLTWCLGGPGNLESEMLNFSEPAVYHLLLYLIFSIVKNPKTNHRFSNQNFS